MMFQSLRALVFCQRIWAQFLALTLFLKKMNLKKKIKGKHIVLVRKMVILEQHDRVMRG